MTLQFCVLLLFSGLAFGSESIPPIVGEGLTRVPENGQAKIGDELKCLKDGQEVSDIEWVLIKDDKRSVITSEDGLSSIKATEQAKYQCKIDEETYAEFEKSYAVVEQEDLKIECKISNRTDAIDIKNDIRIKWYMYDVTGDELSYVDQIGNCSEDLQKDLKWHEVIVDKKGGSEPHINLLEMDEIMQKVLKIEDANRTTDRRAFKCVAYHKDARANCSESAFFVRVRDKYAALWPFLGIVSEVVVICLIIFICERRRAAQAKDQLDEDDEDLGSKAGISSSGNSNVRQRGPKSS